MSTSQLVNRLCRLNIYNCYGIKFRSYNSIIITRRPVTFAIRTNVTRTRVTFANQSCKVRCMCISGSYDANELNHHAGKSPEELREELETEYDQLRRRLDLTNELEKVLIIDPNVKWGKGKDLLSTSQLRLQEAVALIETLDRSSVIDSTVESLKKEEPKTYFGKGKVAELKDRIDRLRDENGVTAVFLNVSRLKSRQRGNLEKIWNCPIYDRYGIVLQIFKQRARSQEAKIQVELAMLKYLKSQLPQGKDMNKYPRSDTGRVGESVLELGQRAIEHKQKQLSKKLATIHQNRAIIRMERQRHRVPTVAVLGYTNAGKTTLIKALTGDKFMVPKDMLFATLDTTVHPGVTSSGLQLVYVDTIGFISELPHDLIESFSATLQDVVNADLLIHVRDVSHPETIKQKENVISVLKKLHLSDAALEHMIEVQNKIDLTEMNFSTESGGENQAVPLSSTKKIGLDLLLEKIEDAVMTVTGNRYYKLAIANGGPELSWLYREATVSSVTHDEDSSQLIVQCIMSDPTYQKYCSKFSSTTVN